MHDLYKATWYGASSDKPTTFYTDERFFCRNTQGDCVRAETNILFLRGEYEGEYAVYVNEEDSNCQMTVVLNQLVVHDPERTDPPAWFLYRCPKDDGFEAAFMSHEVYSKLTKQLEESDTSVLDEILEESVEADLVKKDLARIYDSGKVKWPVFLEAVARELNIDLRERFIEVGYTMAVASGSTVAVTGRTFNFDAHDIAEFVEAVIDEVLEDRKREVMDLILSGKVPVRVSELVKYFKQTNFVSAAFYV